MVSDTEVRELIKEWRERANEQSHSVPGSMKFQMLHQCANELGDLLEDTGENGEWPYCPNCGDRLERPAELFGEVTDCPNCGPVCIEFQKL